MPDNFYGNDPSLGLIRAGDQKYSLPDSERDASSSGNTFQVGTGPQPNLPAGRFLPGEIAGALRRQTQAAAAAARAAQPPPPPVSPTFIAGSAVPAQTTLPNPVTPVAVPSFVTSTGLPSFGSSNLLATSVPGATGGLPNVPNIGSPLQPLLATPSTLPATGTSVPNIGSNLGSQSVFTQLFPSVPDISQTATATAADGGPILASDSLPRYQNAGDVNAELEARRPEIMTGLREFFVERGRYTDEQFLAEFGRMSTKDLLREFMAQEKAEESFRDSFPSLRGFPSPEPSPDAPPETPSLRPPYEIPKNYYPPGYEFPEEGPTELDYDMRLPEQFQAPGEWQVADSGPILASEYLNAGGPVQYFSNGGNTGVLDAAPPGHFPAYITSDEAEMLRAQGGGVTPDGGQYMANGIPVFQSTTGNTQSVSDAVSFGQTEADVAQSVQNAAFEASLEEAGKTEGTKIGRIPNPIQQGSLLTPDPTLGPVLGGKVEGITAEEAFSLTAQDFDNLSQAQRNALARNPEALAALQPQIFSESGLIKTAFEAINPKGLPEVARAIAADLNRTNPVTGSLTPAAQNFRAQTASQYPGAQFLFRPASNTGGLFNAEGGPILASERLNAGGPVQYFNEGDSVSPFPGEGEYGPAGSTINFGSQVSPDSQAAGPAADQSKDQSRSLADTAITYGKSALKSGAMAVGLSPLGVLSNFITGPLAMNSFVTGMRNAQEGLDVESKDFAEAAGKFAHQQLGLSLSKNQAYPGDYGYGLDPDTDYSNQTAFSRTISSPSESDFDPDDPLQLQTGGPVQYFQEGQGVNAAFSRAPGGVGGEFGGLGFDAGVGMGGTRGTAGGTTGEIDLVTPFLTESRDLIPQKIPGIPKGIPSDVVKALSQLLPKVSIADLAKAIGPNLARYVAPGTSPIGWALNTVLIGQALDQGKVPPGVAGLAVKAAQQLGYDIPSALKGKIGMETRNNPAEQGSVFSPMLSLQEQGGG